MGYVDVHMVGTSAADYSLNFQKSVVLDIEEPTRLHVKRNPHYSRIDQEHESDEEKDVQMKSEDEEDAVVVPKTKKKPKKRAGFT